MGRATDRSPRRFQGPAMVAIILALAACAGPSGPSGSVAATSDAAATGPAVSRSAEPPPTSPPPSAVPTAVPAILVGAGDIASCSSSGDEATAALLAGLAGTDGTVFTAGDNVYDNGTAREFHDCYAPTWGSELARTLPAPGNHDYNTAHAAGYFAYFGGTAGDPGEGWYARDVGAWRIYVLNSNCWAVGGCGAGSAQEQWLRADLAANPRACVLAIWHQPRFSSGEHGSSTATSALWQALADAGAEIVVNGHDHDYERFAPQTVDGAADPKGLVEFVVGTGGRSHYAFRTTAANSVIRNGDTYGVIDFTLYPASWSFSFVPVEGGTFTDAGSGTCH
ncbi:MAG: metallophosphoesterase [Chloroflexi bacterium]|nr:metallophosphoesterase [Chloroflexota bacterium]